MHHIGQATAPELPLGREQLHDLPAVRVIPYDYVADFTLNGGVNNVGNLIQDVINIGVEGVFVAVSLGYGLNEAREILARLQVRPERNGSFPKRQLGTANEEIGFGSLLHSQAFTDGAPTKRAVKREVMRIQRLKTAATFLTSQMLTKSFHAPSRFFPVRVDMGHHHDAPAKVQCGLHGVGDATALISANGDSIDHHLNFVLAPVINSGRFVDAVGLAIDANAYIARPPNIIPNCFVSFLAFALDGGK